MMEPVKVPIKKVVDDRGTLYQLFNEGNGKLTFDGSEYLDLPPIKRIYVINNSSVDIIRGMHFHAKEWKFFFVVRGSVKAIITPDDHVTEKTKSFELSTKKPEVLIIPPNNYNGWKALEEDTLLFVLSNFSLEESLADDSRIPVDSFLDLFKVKDK